MQVVGQTMKRITVLAEDHFILLLINTLNTFVMYPKIKKFTISHDSVGGIPLYLFFIRYAEGQPRYSMRMTEDAMINLCNATGWTYTEFTALADADK